jgi:hypothetical protein
MEGMPEIWEFEDDDIETKPFDENTPYWDAVKRAYGEIQKEKKSFGGIDPNSEKFEAHWEWMLDNEWEKVRLVRIRMLMNQYPGLSEDKAKFYLIRPDALMRDREEGKVLEEGWDWLFKENEWE